MQGESERQEDRPALDGTALARQVGQFEAATGLAHGPGVVLVAAAAALLVLPIKRVLAAVTARYRKGR